MSDQEMTQAGEGESTLATGANERNLDFLRDVPLEVTVELGRKEMPISDILTLSKGAVVELAKVAGEPLDIRVNGHLIAHGEAVVVNEKFGVRLTDVISRSHRVAQLS